MLPSRILRTAYVMGTPGLRNQTFFTQIIDEFPKPCARNYYNSFKSWTKPEIEEAVFNIILDNTDAPVANVSMEANMAADLEMSLQTRFAVQDELQIVFQFRIPEERFHARDLASGREASDWVTSIMEEFSRLKY